MHARSPSRQESVSQVTSAAVHPRAERAGRRRDHGLLAVRTLEDCVEPELVDGGADGALGLVFLALALICQFTAITPRRSAADF